MRRAASLWLVLFAAYAATVGVPAFGDAQYGGDEPHYLLTADSIAGDGDVDLTDEYADRAYADWYPYALERRGTVTNGQANEPHPPGLPLLIAPAYAVGGPVAVELFLAALHALAFVFAAVLARRLVPEPWASGAALVAGLSPPALAHGTAVYPELVAGGVLAAAALLALRARERSSLGTAFWAAALLATLPWLGTKYVVPGAALGLALLYWLWRQRRGFHTLVAAEVLLFSGIAYITVNERLYGGLTPEGAVRPGDPPTGAESAVEYLERSHRLVALWLDGGYGALRWAPFAALAFYALYLVWRSRRDRLSVALPGQRDVEIAALLCAVVCAAQVLVAAFLAPEIFGFFFPGRHLIAALPVAAALCAWGLRHAPRVGGALAAVTLVTSAWLYAELRIAGEGWIGPQSAAPLGPLEDLLPRFAQTTPWTTAVIAGVVAGIVVLVVRQWVAVSSRGRRTTSE